MSEAQYTPDPLPDAQVTEGRGGPAIQERPFWSKVMAGKESWLPATLVGVILAVVTVIAFFFLRDARFSEGGPRRFDNKAVTYTNLKASRELGAAGDGGQAPLPPIAKLPDPVNPPMPVGPVSVHPVTPAPAGAAPRNRFDAPLLPNEGTGKDGQGGYGGGSATMVQPATTGTPAAQQGSNAGTFDGNLKSAPTPRAQAGLIGNRNLLLAKGTLLDCVLNTAINSTIPGMVSCTLTRNVYSDNGKVLLLERGSTVTGEFGGRVRTGQTRIYVLWNRIKTPKGVVVNLDSPGSDALGRSGVDGEVDKHWGERIGNAFLLSLIQDAIGYAATRGNNQNGSSQMYFQNTQQTGDNMANTILKDSLQIPPTITKKQGERVAIFVARDLDFSAVYDLMPQVPVQQTNTPQP
ncbi:hypothetical protein SHINM1_005500 [Fluviibacter phosphoraccumulans]|nr:hypothetical protein SHINM1_005500 [Fluviibacter phosphoraccumulans]